MSDKQLYEQLLGISSDWKVSDVQIDFSNQKVDVFITNKEKTKFPCPKCQQLYSVFDHREERNWRHLDTMQFKTILHAQIPRIRCKEHGKVSVDVSWADKYSRFTKLFETLAIDLLLASKNQAKMNEILDLSWDEIHQIQKKAVERGLNSRKELTTRYIGVDEKSFKKGHKYITILYDLETSAVIDIEEDRTEKSLKTMLNKLTPKEKESIKAVSADMWEAFTNAIKQELPYAKVVYDKYHIISHLNKAVNQVRIEENKKLIQQQINTLKNTKFLWLKNKENMSDKQLDMFDELYHIGLEVAKAWNLREYIKYLWEFSDVKRAKNFFKKWYERVKECNLTPMLKVADMIKSKLENIITFVEHSITNAVAEGINSKIQNIKHTARGFRNLENFKTAILFYCGNLQLYPQ
jgi:transposase